MSEEQGEATGKRRRHDGRDPWAVVVRERVAAEAEIREVVPGEVGGGAPAVGQCALIVLERLSNDPQGRFEAVWCEVTGVEGERIEAVLDNQPTWIRGIAAGDPIAFDLGCVLRVG